MLIYIPSMCFYVDVLSLSDKLFAFDILRMPSQPEEDFRWLHETVLETFQIRNCRSDGKPLQLWECLWNPAWWRERRVSIELHEQKGSLSNPIQILVSFSLLLTRSKEINKEIHGIQKFKQPFAIHETFQLFPIKKHFQYKKKHTKSVSCLSETSELCRFPPQVLRQTFVKPIPPSSVQETVTRPPWCKGLEESGVFFVLRSYQRCAW